LLATYADKGYFFHCKWQERISVHHFVPENGRKEFQSIILLLQIEGRNFSVAFCCSELEEGISA
jgi:hypothetical protein